VEASPAPTKRIAVGEVVSETFSTYGQNFGALIGAAIVVFVIVGLAAGLLQTAGGLVMALLASIVQLIGYAVFTGFVVRLVQDVRDGRRDQGVGDLFSSATGAILPLIVFAILWAIVVGIGFFLLIIPGLILVTFLCVGAPAIVVEREGPLGAFGRSWNLVRGDAWSVFASLLVILIIVLAIQFVLGAIATPISDGAIVVASIISSIITAPIFAIAVSVMFFDLGGGRGAAAPAATEPAPTEPPPPPPPPAAPAG
jgi:hypothetical protein